MGVRGEDLTGKRFGHQIVLGYVGQSSKRHSLWLVRCDCGSERSVIRGALVTGRIISCACRAVEPRRVGVTKHGLSGTVEHDIWCGIKKRCFNSNYREFRYYGGRGITMCKGFRDDFVAFKTAVGERPTPKHSIDRRDNDGHYSCGNCSECIAGGWLMNLRWATPSEQRLNSRKAGTA